MSKELLYNNANIKTIRLSRKELNEIENIKIVLDSETQKDVSKVLEFIEELSEMNPKERKQMLSGIKKVINSVTESKELPVDFKFVILFIFTVVMNPPSIIKEVDLYDLSNYTFMTVFKLITSLQIAQGRAIMSLTSIKSVIRYMRKQSVWMDEFITNGYGKFIYNILDELNKAFAFSFKYVMKDFSKRLNHILYIQNMVTLSKNV